MRDARAPPPPIRAILGDARELPGVEKSSVHLVVTSPPYPMIPQWDEQFRAWGARGFDGMHERLSQVWRACRDALVPGGLLAINIGDALRSTDGEFRLWSNHVRVALACEALGLRALPYLLWKKPTNRPNAFLGSGFLPPNAYVTLDCEFILLFRKGNPRRFPPRDEARFASRYAKAERDVWFSQIWSVRGARQDGVARRTGAFPPEIPERLIRMFSVTGETVLDPFAGTGTTLWAAARLGRKAIGIEIDPERYEELVRRIPTLGPATSPARAGAPSPRPRPARGSGARGR